MHAAIENERNSLCGRIVAANVTVRDSHHLAAFKLLLLGFLLLQLCNGPDIHYQLVSCDGALPGTERARKPNFTRHLGLLEPCAPPADDVDAPSHELHIRWERDPKRSSDEQL